MNNDDINKIEFILTNIKDVLHETNIFNILKKIKSINEDNNLIITELTNELLTKNSIIQDLNSTIVKKNLEIDNLLLDIDNFSKVSVIVSLHKELDSKKKYIKLLESQISKYKNDKLIPKVNNEQYLSENTKEQSLSENIKELDKLDKSTSVKLVNIELSKSQIINEEIDMEEIPKEMDIKEINEIDKADYIEDIQHNENIIKIKTKTRKKNNQELKNHEINKLETPSISMNEEIIKTKSKKKNIDDLNKNNTDNEQTKENISYPDINGYELLIYKNIYYYRDLETNEIYDIINKTIGNIVGLITEKNKIKLN